MTDGCHDFGSDVVNIFVTAMLEVFDPASACPPLGGGSTDVRFFGGEALPLSAWNQINCKQPFLWVRVAQRFRTNDIKRFTAPSIESNPVELRSVMAIEVGVGRCALMEAEPTWDDWATEAEVSLDDSWRLDKVACRAATLLKPLQAIAGKDAILPYGPDGGVIAWTCQVYVQY